MKKYILFFFIGILLLLEHLDTQTALQTKVDVTVTAVVKPAQHALQMVNDRGKQINTITFVQNLTPENSTDIQSSQFELSRGIGVPGIRISQGNTQMSLDQNTINYSNGATGTLDFESSNSLGTNINQSRNIIVNEVIATNYSDMTEVATAYPVLTVSVNKVLWD